MEIIGEASAVPVLLWYCWGSKESESESESVAAAIVAITI